jgi:hypothetical protein
MCVCYLYGHETRLWCYLVIHIQNLLHPLQLFYFLQILYFWTLSIILSLSKNCPVYFSKHVSETGFCLRLLVKPIQLGPIDRASPYLWSCFTSICDLFTDSPLYIKISRSKLKLLNFSRQKLMFTQLWSVCCCHGWLGPWHLEEGTAVWWRCGANPTESGSWKASQAAEYHECSPKYNIYWAQWNFWWWKTAYLESNRKSTDGQSKTAQLVLPHSKIKEVLTTAPQQIYKRELGVNQTLYKVRQRYH